MGELRLKELGGQGQALRSLQVACGSLDEPEERERKEGCVLHRVVKRSLRRGDNFRKVAED